GGLAGALPTRRRVVLRVNEDRGSIRIAPRARLDRFLRMCRVELGAQDRAIANPAVHGAFKGFHGCAWTRRSEGRITTGFHPTSGVEYIVAQHDILARDILLVRATAIIATDDAAVGGRPL